MHVVIAEFEQFDQDKDNALNIEELKKLMEGLGEPQTHRAVKDMIALVDDDKDGKISFREFLMIFRKGAILANPTRILTFDDSCDKENKRKENLKMTQAWTNLQSSLKSTYHLLYVFDCNIQSSNERI